MSVYVLYQLVSGLFNFYSILVLVYCILSWVPISNPHGLLADFAGALQTIVGPYLNIFRRFIPPFGGIDFSPVIAILALNLIERLVLNIIL